MFGKITFSLTFPNVLIFSCLFCPSNNSPAIEAFWCPLK